MVCVGGGLDEDEAREPVMMKQITTTTTQVGNVQTPQENLLCTNCQSISNQRGHHAGLRLGGEGPEAELGGKGR